MEDNSEDTKSEWRKMLDILWENQVFEFKNALWIGLVGAVIGAVLAGGIGFKYFDTNGLLIGTAAGAILGGVGLALMYLGTTLFFD